MRMHYRFIKVDNCHQISAQSDCDFIFLIQRALLLGLKETGQLNEMQHRQAEAVLLDQYRDGCRENTVSSKDD